MLRESFGLETHSLYDDLPDIGGRSALTELVGHRKHGLDSEEFAKKAAESSEIYFVKTHHPPQDDAKAIYVLRDGRSAIVSYYHYLKDFAEQETSLDDVTLGDCMFGSWSDHLAAWSPKSRPNTLFFHYDELVREPERAIERLAEFIGREPLKSAAVSFAGLQAVDSKFFRSGSDAKNIAELTGASLDLFWATHGELMVEYGYVDSVPSIDPRGIGRLFLAKQREFKARVSVIDADRAARLDLIRKLDAQLAALEEDRAARIAVLETALAASEADRAAQRALAHGLEDQLAASLADGEARLKFIRHLETELANSQADREARLAVIHNLEAQIACLQAKLRPLAQVGPYAVLRLA